MAGRKGQLGPAAERVLAPLEDDGIFQMGYGVAIAGAGAGEKRFHCHDGATGGYSTTWILVFKGEQVLVASVSNARAAMGALTTDVLPLMVP